MTNIKNLEMADLFQVEVADGEKYVRRWGFFVKEDANTYAVYKPEHVICSVGVNPVDSEPGDIQMVSATEMDQFISKIQKTILPLHLEEVTKRTKCGWYYAA